MRGVVTLEVLACSSHGGETTSFATHWKIQQVKARGNGTYGCALRPEVPPPTTDGCLGSPPRRTPACLRIAPDISTCSIEGLEVWASLRKCSVVEESPTERPLRYR